MGRARAFAVGTALAVGLLQFGTGCGDEENSSPEAASAEQASSLTVDDLGEPAPSGVGPAVVPAVATSNPEGGPGFFEIADADADVVIEWYERHMPPGEDFEELVWLESLVDPFDVEADWYWCSAPGESLDIAIYDDGSIGIQIHPVSDGACG